MRSGSRTCARSLALFSLGWNATLDRARGEGGADRGGLTGVSTLPFNEALLLRLSELSAPYVLDFGPRTADVPWVVGDGRSGTTWVANLLNYRGDSRLLFEPFHPTKVRDVKSYPLFLYLRRDSQDPRLEQFYTDVFTGKLPTHRRIDQYNPHLFYRSRLVKDIFANLFLQWVDHRFPQIKKILVLRHPFAVAVSKKRNSSWKWMEDPRSLLKQRELMEDHLEPFRDLLEASLPRFERQVLLWCLFHYVPFRELKREQVHLVFYEELCQEPEAELRRLFDYLGEPLDEKDARLKKQLKSTFQVTSASAIVQGGDLIGSWRRSVTAPELEAGEQLLRRFGLHEIYGGSLRPEREKAEALFG